MPSPCCWGDRCFLILVSHATCLGGSQWRTFLHIQSAMSQAWRNSGVRLPLKHTDTWQVACSLQKQWWLKYARVLIAYIIYRLAHWAKLNTQQLNHLNLNFSLLPWNFTSCSHGIYCTAVFIQFAACFRLTYSSVFFTVNTASLTNVGFHAQHYSFAEEWLKGSTEAKRRSARPIFWFVFIQSISMGSLSLAKLSLSENFAWTKNKSGGTIFNF